MEVISCDDWVEIGVFDVQLEVAENSKKNEKVAKVYFLLLVDMNYFASVQP